MAPQAETFEWLQQNRHLLVRGTRSFPHHRWMLTLDVRETATENLADLSTHFASERVVWYGLERRNDLAEDIDASAALLTDALQRWRFPDDIIAGEVAVLRERSEVGGPFHGKTVVAIASGQRAPYGAPEAEQGGFIHAVTLAAVGEP